MAEREPTTAAAIVEAVLRDLLGRRGVGDELQMVEADDPETWAELKAELVEEVQAVLDGR